MVRRGDVPSNARPPDRSPAGTYPDTPPRVQVPERDHHRRGLRKAAGWSGRERGAPSGGYGSAPPVHRHRGLPRLSSRMSLDGWRTANRNAVVNSIGRLLRPLGARSGLRPRSDRPLVAGGGDRCPTRVVRFQSAPWFGTNRQSSHVHERCSRVSTPPQRGQTSTDVEVGVPVLIGSVNAPLPRKPWFSTVRAFLWARGSSWGWPFP